MVHAKEECSKRSLTDESLLHLGTHGPGCKIEKGNFKDQKQKPGEENTSYTREQIVVCQGREITQAGGVI